MCNNTMDAIINLEALCLHAPTAERFNLLGSAYKRLALMQELTPARLNTLDKMAAAYEQSFKLGGSGEAYSFSNWGIAKVLALRLDAARSDDWRLTLEGECTRLRSKLQDNNECNPTFWNSTGSADLDLVRLLVRSTSCRNAPDQLRSTGGTDHQRLLQRIQTWSQSSRAGLGNRKPGLADCLPR
ncbi:tetratricopeptide repeat-containing protein [Azotobacter chroococcum]